MLSRPCCVAEPGNARARARSFLSDRQALKRTREKGPTTKPAFFLFSPNRRVRPCRRTGEAGAHHGAHGGICAASTTGVARLRGAYTTLTNGPRKKRAGKPYCAEGVAQKPFPRSR